LLILDQLGLNVADRGVLPAFIPGVLQTGAPPGAETGRKNNWTFIDSFISYCDVLSTTCFQSAPPSARNFSQRRIRSTTPIFFCAFEVSTDEKMK
jgi:hypothetical protein